MKNEFQDFETIQEEKRRHAWQSVIYTILSALLLAAAVFWILPAVLSASARSGAVEAEPSKAVARIALETMPSPSMLPEETVEVFSQGQIDYEAACGDFYAEQDLLSSAAKDDTQQAEREEGGSLLREGAMADALNSVVSVVGVSRQDKAGLAAELGLFDHRNEVSRGTGLVLNADGYILTQSAAVSGAKHVYVELAGGYRAKSSVVGSDHVTGVVVLKLEPDALDEGIFMPAEVNLEATAAMGDRIIAVADPCRATLSPVIYQGVVSGPDTYLNYDGQDISLCLTDIPYKSGLAGAPALNSAGEIFGLLRASGEWPGVGEDASDQASAVPVDVALSVAERLIADGQVQWPGIGVALRYIDERLADEYEVARGLYVSEVYAGSAAKKYGLRIGDIIIADEEHLGMTTESLAVACEEMEVGDRLHLKIWRNGRERDVEIRLMDLNFLK
ncbi:MAG: S1C family serine protease [Christensenellales bacterium]|jgi:serine protease Do